MGYSFCSSTTSWFNLFVDMGAFTAGGSLIMEYSVYYAHAG